jgi:hypothetical protein
MPLWNALWCYFNSSALNSVLSLTFLATFGVIIPSLFQLKTINHNKVGDRFTPFIEYSDQKRNTIILGISTMVCSIAQLFLFYKTLTQMGGETCDVKIVITNPYVYLIPLYIITFVVVLLDGLFFFFFRKALELQKKLLGQGDT